MAANDDERDRLRSVALQNARTILLARDRAEEELRRQSEWLRVTLDSIGDAVISTDARGRITFMNGVAESLTGWLQAEAAGRSLSEVFNLVYQRTRQPVPSPALVVLHELTVTGSGRHPSLISRDRTERPIGHLATPMHDEAGVAVGAVVVFRDVTEQKRGEEARARLASIIDSSQDAIVSTTLGGTIRSWNAGAARLFGYTSQEALGQPVTLIIPDSRQDEVRLVLQRLHQGERVEHFETVRVNKSGGLLDVSCSLSLLRNGEGQAIGVSGIIRDISSQKQAEQEQLRLQQAVEGERSQLAEVFHRAPSFLAVLHGPKHVFELANERYYELIGKREIIGRPARDALPELAGQGFFESLDRVYQTGDAVVATDARLMLRRDLHEPPEERFLEFVYQPLRQAGGAVSGILVQGIDLTDRKRAQETLARVTAASDRQRRLYKTILSSTPDFVYVVSLDYRILYANKSLLKMWDCNWLDAVGKTFSEVGYETWQAEMHCREIDQVRATKRPVRGEAPFTGIHGRRIYDYIFVPVFGAEGEVEAVAATSRDVTERRQMEDVLRETDRNKDEFIALLAHELRNPLAPLRNGLQVMRLAEGDASMIAEVRCVMERQLEHMVRLIDDLLDISRLSRNKMELRISRVLLNDVVTSALETSRSTVEAAGHQLTVALPPEPVYLNADLTRLAQVLTNLLTNSAKYTQNGGRIRLSVERQEADVVITVEDTGIGIPAESLPRVFDMFSQVDRSIERSTGGLGIGLALVKGLVEKHGGTVTAASEGPGKGSTFAIRLPALASDAQPAAAIAPDETAAAGGRKRRVLVVDDNRDSAESMAMMLRLAGNHVATAGDGLEAVEAAAEFRPHVILMDLGMPKLNGFDATRRIRERADGTQVTIIAMTGWGQEQDRAKSKAAGCDGHLVKPVSLPELEELLAGLADATSDRQATSDRKVAEPTA